MSNADIAVRLTIILGSGTGLWAAVDHLTASHEIGGAGWTVRRAGWGGWCVYLDGELDPSGPRFLTKRGATRYARGL